MAIHIVRLGESRLLGEGLRIGAVRRPPRGVAKSAFARDDWFDVWYPLLSPTPELVKEALAAETDAQWKTFVRKFRKEMTRPEASHTLELLAALSQHSDFSIGCYCEDEDRCHRSVLRELLAKRGAKISLHTH